MGPLSAIEVPPNLHTGYRTEGAIRFAKGLSRVTRLMFVAPLHGIDAPNEEERARVVGADRKYERMVHDEAYLRNFNPRHADADGRSGRGDRSGFIDAHVTRVT